MKHYKVVAAVIEHEGAILCTQKGEHMHHYLRYKYEFPGGKVEGDERDEDALIREIEEELALTINVNRKIAVVNYQYPDFMITLTAFQCSSTSRKITLTEHIQAIWLPKDKLKTLDWVAADQPILQYL
ncbi:(deoxy)nucleoside triphosphate pyrophosphohydrolase [Olivibacter sp. CPCC 100613]|uniref:(deoxy)nucleoside triphosphate pyrophosphohydrolase n=1 Tax=Olivibacter sp. CPCC 100613 TaxID=3079931 RepID=UPI002FFD0EF2